MERLQELSGVYPGAYVMQYVRDSNNHLTLYIDFPANMEASLVCVEAPAMGQCT